MPSFNVSEQRTAKISITITPVGLPCHAELWLSPDGTARAATSGVIDFTSTGSPQQINAPIIMPGVGSYRVYIVVYAETLLLQLKRANEDVDVIMPTGMPTTEEVQAVRATVRASLDALWFDPCAEIQLDDAMQAALVAALAPLNQLSTRYEAEKQRVTAEWHVTNDPALNNMQAQMTEYGRQIGVISTGFTIALNTIIANGYGYTYSQGQPLNTVEVWSQGAGGKYPRGVFSDYMPAEAAALAIQWNVSIYDSLPAYINLDNAYQSVYQSYQLLLEQLYQVQLPIQRLKDELFYGYWYCGFPLGY